MLFSSLTSLNGSHSMGPLDDVPSHNDATEVDEQVVKVVDVLRVILGRRDDACG